MGTLTLRFWQFRLLCRSFPARDRCEILSIGPVDEGGRYGLLTLSFGVAYR